jgi:hypothetical protein
MIAAALASSGYEMAARLQIVINLVAVSNTGQKGYNHLRVMRNWLDSVSTACVNRSRSFTATPRPCMTDLITRVTHDAIFPREQFRIMFWYSGQ